MTIIDRIAQTKDISDISIDYMPTIAKFEICSKCSLHCKFCGISQEKCSKRDRLVTDDEFNRFLEFIGKIQTIKEVALFYYGEAALHPHLSEFYKKLKLKNYYTFLTTNGTVKDNLMCSIPFIDSVKVSWNYIDFIDFHEKTGGSLNQYNDIISNTLAFYDEVHRYGKKLTVSTIYDGDQKKYIPALSKLKYDEHYWLPLYSMNGVNKSGTHGQTFGFQTQSIPCSQLFKFLHVDSNLNVRTCFCGHNDAQILFNIKNMDFYIPEKLKRLREQHIKMIIPEECINCLT